MYNMQKVEFGETS